MADEARSHTQVAQLTTAVVVAIVLLFLTKPLQYLPNCVLSSVVFLIGLKLIDVKGMREVYRLRRDEFWVAALDRAGRRSASASSRGSSSRCCSRSSCTFAVTTRRSTSSSRATQRGTCARSRRPRAPTSQPGIVVYRFGGGVFYANATRLSEEMLGLVDVDDPPRWLVLDCAAIDDIDYTGGKTLAELADQLKARKVQLALCVVYEKLRTQLDTFEITAKIGAEHIYETADDAIEAFHASSSTA